MKSISEELNLNNQKILLRLDLTSLVLQRTFFMLAIFKKISKKISTILLMGFLFSMPISNSILCIESDGSSSIENAPLGSCLATEASNIELTASVDREHKNDAHDDCIDCTDVSLSQTLSTKLQSEFDYSIVPDILVANDTSYEVSIYTEPIVSIIPAQAYLPNQLHEHLQTIVLII